MKDTLIITFVVKVTTVLSDNSSKRYQINYKGIKPENLFKFTNR